MMMTSKSELVIIYHSKKQQYKQSGAANVTLLCYCSFTAILITLNKTNVLAVTAIHQIGREPVAAPRQVGGGATEGGQANGLDDSAVAESGFKREPKSIGNSTTAPHDLVADDHIKITFLALCESVATQLRSEGYKCRTVQISIQTIDLNWYERQAQPDYATSNAKDLLQVSLDLFHRNHPHKPVRSLGVRACNLIPAGESDQLSFFTDHQNNLKQHDLETTIDAIRNRYGYEAIRRGVVFFDKILDLDANSSERSNSFMQR